MSKNYSSLPYASLQQLELTREVAHVDLHAGSAGRCYARGPATQAAQEGRVCMMSMDGDAVCAEVSKVAFLDGASHILGVQQKKVCPR